MTAKKVADATLIDTLKSALADDPPEFTMQPTFSVIVNRTDERSIAGFNDIDRLCADLASRPVFTVDVLGERRYRDPTLYVIVESGRATVFYMDLDRGIKLISRDQACGQTVYNRDFIELACKIAGVEKQERTA